MADYTDILNTLTATLEADNDRRNAAEAHLQQVRRLGTCPCVHVIQCPQSTACLINKAIHHSFPPPH